MGPEGTPTFPCHRTNLAWKPHMGLYAIPNNAQTRHAGGSARNSPWAPPEMTISKSLAEAVPGGPGQEKVLGQDPLLPYS